MYSLQIEGGGVKSLRIAALDEDLGQYEVVWQLGRGEALGVWQMGQADTGGRSVLVTTEREAGSTGAGHLAMDSFLSFPVQSCDTVPEAAQVTTTTAVPDSTTTTTPAASRPPSPTTTPATTAPPSADCEALCSGADGGAISGGLYSHLNACCV